MRASGNRAWARTADNGLPKALPAITLSRREALWTLAQLGFRGASSESTFHEYVKLLRKLGTPFERGKIGYADGRDANYTYCHLMELALVLTLRVYHVVPDSVIAEVVRYRGTLHRHFCRAYAERWSGIGASITVESADHEPIDIRGTFLDLQLNFSGGKRVSFGPPKLLSPFKALHVFVERDVAARSLLP